MICLSKTKICRIILEAFHFYATYFILSFLLRQFFKTVGEIRHLLTLSSKLTFRGALKKAFMVPEEKSYQKQYFVKIFLSLLASKMHIHFYFHLKESSENAHWIAIALKSATFRAPESAPETALETTYFMLLLKNLTKNLETKLMIVFVLIEYISFTHLFFFLLATSFVIGRNSPAMHDCRKTVFMKQHLYFFPKHFKLILFVKNYY